MANYRHGATYGSLAYDLDALAREKQLDEAGKLPQKKVRPAQPEVQPVQRRQSAARAAVRPSPVLLLGTVLVVGMVIALMLCYVTGGEFLAAKTLAVLAGTLLVDTMLFFLTGFGPAQLPVFLLVCTAGSITMLLLGGLTGIVCRDQTSTGTIAGPLALVFMLPTMFAGMGGVLQKVASFVPTTATADLMFLGLGHQSWMGANVLWDVAVLAVWTAGSAGLFALAFRKKGVDN